jgi:hypothetical protein
MGFFVGGIYVCVGWEVDRRLASLRYYVMI